MTADRRVLWLTALEMIGRRGLSYGQAAKLLGVTRSVIAGWDMRAKAGDAPASPDFKPKPKADWKPSFGTFGAVRA